MEESSERLNPPPVGGKPSTMQEILSLAQALSLAVDRGFMKREHAGAIWKRLLIVTNIDTTKKRGGEDINES